MTKKIAVKRQPAVRLFRAIRKIEPILLNRVSRGSSAQRE
jgi:hypothetical protein